MEPEIGPITLPKAYGTPTRTMEWSTVLERLRAAHRFWLATTRPDGRPHSVPIDGVWVGEAFYFGGSPETVHQRNMAVNQEVVVHVEDTKASIIVEGRAVLVPITDEVLRVTEEKYGWAPPATHEWMLEPRRVLAWDDLSANATRFTWRR
ncbi:pyridoxamine 5'-phosphate oxidase family protein [Nonomuraea sp. NPDC050663]|uniref:pyridoxamine 5'-phosphate oxidase family protein n=1 Tax=Nonomuraea sp. NPDC050663 TaxID=3364370 RepID=UPI0037A9ADC8